MVESFREKFACLKFLVDGQKNDNVLICQAMEEILPNLKYDYSIEVGVCYATVASRKKDRNLCTNALNGQVEEICLSNYGSYK